MRNKVVNVAALLAGILALGLAPDAGALPFNFEMRELLPELNPIARDVYVGCTTCTLAQYDAIVVPAGWEKAAPRVQLFQSGSVVLPTPPPGVAPDADFVPGIPGPEFVYTARVLGGAVVGFDAALGFLSVAQVQRDNQLTYDAGTVVHEVIDTGGERYILFTFDHAASLSTYDLLSVGSLAALGLPAGWSYESRVLSDALTIDSGGLATVFAQGNLGSYQQYSVVPEPGVCALLGGILMFGTAARSRRAG